MSITDGALKRPSVTLFVAAGVFLVGGYSYVTLPREANPDVAIPIVLFTVPYPGASPEEAESEVLTPIEKELAALDGVERITAYALGGAVFGAVQFEERLEVEDARRELYRALQKAEPEFPDEVQPFEVKTISFGDVPVILLNVWGSDDGFLLRDVAEDLKRDVEALPGVSKVGLFGGRRREALIEADPLLLAEFDLTLADLAVQVKARHQNLPGGDAAQGEARIFHRALAKFETLDEIRAMPLLAPRGATLVVGDVASVRSAPARIESLARFQRIGAGPATECATLMVSRKPDANTIDVVDRVVAEMSRLQKKLPEGLSITPANNQKRWIMLMMRQLGSSALYGGVLVVLVLFLAMGLRNALIIAAAIPFSLLICFALMQGAGISLNAMSLFALILILGMVVDGAIIAGENVYRQHEQGLRGVAASSRGLREIGWAVVSADVTTIAAFLPMLMVVGVMGDFISLMPKIVAFTLAGSMIVDHLVLPVVAAFWMRVPPAADASAPGVCSRFERFAGAAPRWFDRALSALRNRYVPVLEWALDHPRRLLAAVSILFLSALALLVSGALGNEFVPKVDMDRFTIELFMPERTPIEVTAREVRRIEDLVARYAENHPGAIESTVTTVGDAGALNADPREGDAFGAHVAQVAVSLTEARSRTRGQSAIVRDLERQARGLIPGARLIFKELREGPPVGADLAVHVHADELAALRAAGRGVERLLHGMPEVEEVSNSLAAERAEWQTRFDAGAASQYGVSARDVGRTVLLSTLGEKVSTFRLDDDEWDLRVIAPDAFAANPDLLELAGVPRPGASPVPLSAVAVVEPGSARTNIEHRNRRRCVTVRCEVREGVDVGVVLRKLERAVEAERQAGRFAAGATLSFGGGTDERDLAMDSLYQAMIVAVLLIFLILALQFNSLLQVLVVLTTVPLSMIGVCYGLLLSNEQMGFMPFLGVVALTGIIVNDAIVLVDRINQNRRESGMELRESILEAGHTRLRPVLLTTFTTVGGLLPLGINLGGGGEFWRPLCWTIVFGLLFATFLTLVIVPVLYYGVARRIGGGSAGSSPPVSP